MDVYDVSDPAAPNSPPSCFTSSAPIRAARTPPDRTCCSQVGQLGDVYDVAAPADPPRDLPTAANSSAALFVGDHVIVASDDGRVMDWPPAHNVLQVGTKNVFQVPATPSGSRMFARRPV